MALQELLGRIRQEQGEFPAAQRLVAAYVVENYYQIPFLSITTLAKNIGVSDNTVVKFCNHLGYEKFTEFKRVFSDYAHSELVIFNKLSEGEPEQGKDDSLFSREMEEDVASIQATLSDPLNRQNLPKLLDMMDRAQHIYVTGGRASGVMAAMFVNMLRYLNLRVHELGSGVGDYMDRIAMVGPEDLVIALSFPRYTAQVVDALRDLHEAGVPVVLITDTGLSPAYPYADLVFQCAVVSGAYFPCYAGCMSLLSAVSRAVSIARKPDAAQYIRQLEGRLLERGVFL